MYKRRPIYWLFSSGKQRAFQCLVYLHRYHEGTLSRMRTEYVIPLQGKIASRIDQLADDIAAATSTSHRKKLEKERDTLIKQQTELQAFDEKLRHYADQRISLDLDDGVKVNYGKFGDLLAEVKAVTGGSMDDHHEPTREAARQDAEHAGSHPLQRGEALLTLRRHLILFNQRGSHCTYHRADGRVLTIVRPHGRRTTCHPDDIRKLLEALKPMTTYTRVSRLCVRPRTAAGASLHRQFSRCAMRSLPAGRPAQ